MSNIILESAKKKLSDNKKIREDNRKANMEDMIDIREQLMYRHMNSPMEKIGKHKLTGLEYVIHSPDNIYLKEEPIKLYTKLTAEEKKEIILEEEQLEYKKALEKNDPKEKMYLSMGTTIGLYNSMIQDKIKGSDRYSSKYGLGYDY